ncbi:multiheme c-type cytochrome [Lacipirellula sp.]|uniref:multiheme c-type cytochrome n=1 Tax=Lacipirellula sp. TaxID=2691419 RepID=UPI003D0D89D2
MRPTESPTRRLTPLVARTACLFVACAACGMLLAPQSSREQRSGVATLTAADHCGPYDAANSVQAVSANQPTQYASKLKEEVQQMLAQGGCPGWIALASEPDIETAGQREAEVMQDNAIVPAANGEPVPPVVKYPRPVRVGPLNGSPVTTHEGPVMRLVQLPPVDDELISEQDDLLHSSPEFQKGAPAGETPAAVGTAPAQQPAVATPPSVAPQPGAGTPRLAPTVEVPPAQAPAVIAPPVQAPASAPAAAKLRPDDDLLNGVDDLLAPEHSPVPRANVAPQPTAPQPAVPRTAPNPAQDMLNDRGDLLGPEATPRVAPPAAVPAPVAPPVTSPAVPPIAPNGIEPGVGQPPTTTLPLATPPVALPPAGAGPSPFVPPPAGMPSMHGGAHGAAPGPHGGPATGQPGGAAAGGAANAAAGAKAADKRPPGEQSRCTFAAESLYPSAKTCRVCHEKIYEEWSVSSHAYAAVSPMFHRFEQKINDLTQGTIGYFCYRCHSPAGTTLGISRAAPMYDLPPVAREGVTCIACHRIREWYGKTNGERRIEPGDVYAPMYGPFGGDGVAQVIDEKEKFKVKTSPDETGLGQPMHAAAFSFPQLSHASFCTSCHQVAVYPGIKLEVVWEQYRASPACKKGVSCQDCHMGRIPGVPSGYEYGAAAEINKKTVNTDRKHSNHVFYGPGYSIAHPGVFPFNPKADRWSMKDWLQFDWRAGWGTDAFEDAVEDGAIRVTFPEAWKESDDRYDARDIIDENLKKKQVKNQLRAQVMENGSHVNGPFFTKPRVRGQDLEFNYIVTNTNDGHNLPTASLGAQPQLWANVALINPRGERVWESGYLDRFGDLADIHSEDVRHKRIPYDWQLFNLQTMFLITGAKGTDREFFLPVNIDIDPLPFIRPAAQPISVLNHPPFIRMEARSLAPLGSRTVPYKIPGELLCEPGRYRLSFRMRNRTEPMYFMRFCDSTAEMQRAMMEGTLDFHTSSVEFDVE